MIHSYRHRFALVDGDPAYADIEAALARRPTIGVPDDRAVRRRRRRVAGAAGHGGARAASRGRTSIASLDDVGHDVPQEAPQAFAQAVLDVRAMGG